VFSPGEVPSELCGTKTRRLEEAWTGWQRSPQKAASYFFRLWDVGSGAVRMCECSRAHARVRETGDNAQKTQLAAFIIGLRLMSILAREAKYPSTYLASWIT
jgi:hypothetical protein